jgi:hypothetical protein
LRYAQKVVDSQQLLFSRHKNRQLNPLLANQILRACVVPRLGYLVRVMDPHVARPAYEDFDKMVLRCFTDINNLPRELPKHAVDQIRLPVRGNGMGLRATAEIADAAFYAASLPILRELAKRCAAMTSVTLRSALSTPADTSFAMEEEIALDVAEKKHNQSEDPKRNEITFLVSVFRARERLVQAGANCMPNASNLVPRSDEELLAHVSIAPIKTCIQRRLTIALDHCRYMRLMKMLPEQGKARMSSARSPNANWWLLPNPTKSEQWIKRWSRSSVEIGRAHV